MASAFYINVWKMADFDGRVVTGGGYGTSSLDRTPTGFFSWPLEIPGTITSKFGYRKHPILGVTKYHTGTDIAAPQGTPILAAADGTVIIANATDSYGGGYGYCVKIQHEKGYSTLYAHCSSLSVRKGDIVRKGQIIAKVGSTGRSTGPHLHFEIVKDGNRVDPLKFFK